MTQIVAAIVGPMRAGTSAVSQVVHYLGFNAGQTIHAPIPPTWRSDWEDVELAKALSALLPLGDDLPNSRQKTAMIEFLAGYVEHRRRWADLVGEACGKPLPGWSLKSPLLTFFLDELRAVIADEEDLRLRTLCVMRSERGISRSWESTMAKIEGAERTQFGILRELGRQETPFTYIVDYDKLVAKPKEGVLAIAAALDVDNQEAIERAIAVVRQPTTKGVPACGSQV